MKRKELQTDFNSFYNDTYSATMAYCLQKTGDFLNAEDLLANIYYEVYRKLKKCKSYYPAEADKFLKTAIKNQLNVYWRKHRKEHQVKKLPGGQGSLEQFLEMDFDLTEESAERQMLSQDILEYISEQPVPIRRAFVLYFYFDLEPDAIALELELRPETVVAYLILALKRIRKNILNEYI